MAEKIAPGAVRESAPPPPDPHAADVERLRERRDNARWNLVVGVLLMFLGGFSAYLAIGGAAMVLYGAAATLYWGRRHRKAKGDPWAYDPELDAHEEGLLRR